MEKMSGSPLGDKCYSMTPKKQHMIMRQIVELKTRLILLQFPSSGSIYYEKDLPREKDIPLLGDIAREFCLGRIAHYG